MTLIFCVKNDRGINPYLTQRLQSW